jgi:hypothetical protein
MLKVLENLKPYVKFSNTRKFDKQTAIPMSPVMSKNILVERSRLRLEVDQQEAF